MAGGAVQELIDDPTPAPSALADQFEVHLANFDGPFDLLLSLIAKHQLDITEVALSQVTDEFIGYVRAAGDIDLDQTSEFLVVAATLLDLKTARLLPAGKVEDEWDIALLEARDLLFARLLQYRAYKRVAEFFAARLADESLRFPRAVRLEGRYTALLPEVMLAVAPEQLAELARCALEPKPQPELATEHLHAPAVSVAEQADMIADRLRPSGTATFRALSADCRTVALVVARFLALLDLYRDRLVAFEQLNPLGELTVRWVGAQT
ncbi:MAG: segregation/condensation protein A [Jiangellaceae bacterium]|nr:segregation/condensation protein A [Jiangellaceae bacterium]